MLLIKRMKIRRTRIKMKKIKRTRTRIKTKKYLLFLVTMAKITRVKRKVIEIFFFIYILFL